MTITLTVIIGIATSTIITLIVKAIWDWASNKNGVSEFNEIKLLINDLKNSYYELKQTILVEYVKKTDLEQLNKILFDVRDMSMTNRNNVEMIKESSKQNLERMSMIENRINNMEK